MSADAVISEIQGLSDEDATAALTLMSDVLRTDFVERGVLDSGLPAEIDDAQAQEVLRDAATLAAEYESGSPEQRGEAARMMLVALSRDERYTAKLGEALQQRGAVVEPITAFLISAAVLFVLTLDFDVKKEVKDGKEVITWSVKRKRSTLDELKLIFSPVNAIKKLLGIGD